MLVNRVVINVLRFSCKVPVKRRCAKLGKAHKMMLTVTRIISKEFGY
jgi:hypothetical protein